MRQKLDVLGIRGYAGRVGRTMLVGVVAAIALVAAGCGSSSSGSGSRSLTTELSYFPPQSPFVMTARTAAQSSSVASAKTLEAKLPTVAFAKAAIFGALAHQGINYQRDIAPLLGNPVAFGIPSAGGSAASTDFLAVWSTRDGSKLSALVHKLPVHSTGAIDGANLYATSAGWELAVDGATLVFGRNQADVIAALSRHANNQGMSATEYSDAVSGLPSNAAVEIFGDLSQVLAEPGAATARRIPWVAALRGYAATFSTSRTGVTLSFHLSTDSSALSASQLPIANGSGSPSVVGALPIQLGIRDPAQIVDFIESASQATSAHGYAKFLRQEAALRRRTGVDLQALVSQLTGDLTVDSDSRTTLARVDVSDPATVSQILTKVASVPNALGTHDRLRSLGSDRFSITSHGRTALLGVADGKLVLVLPAKGSSATPAALNDFASAATTTIPGTSGAVAFRIKLGQLLALVLKRAPSPIERGLLSLLGDFTGSMSATPSGLSGTATLALK
jgi:hypothetical protein